MTNENDLHNFLKCDVFTPDNICKLMTSKLNNSGTLLEPSVGTGNLLKYINLDNYTTIDVYELKQQYLTEIKSDKINKFHEDFIKANIQSKYSNIILNPPYIKVQDLSIEYRKFLRESFTELKIGLVDIYYAFIIKCLSLLTDDGIMVAITPNSFLYNKSAYNLRKYLFNNCLVKEIIDYKDQKVFNSVCVYCCITVFSKEPKTQLQYNDISIPYSDIVKNYSLFNFNSNETTLKNICKITNGVATLRDKIFIHDTKMFDDPCWQDITNGNKTKSIIYPYKNGKIIEETSLKQDNPETYNYLLENKEELAKRDKGNKKYPAWYAYGRSQSIKYSTKTCIYIPCFIDPVNLENCLFIKKGMLHQGCLCIEPHNEDDINKIINCVIENVEFINENSSKRSGGWINISSRTLYEIPLNPTTLD